MYNSIVAAVSIYVQYCVNGYFPIALPTNGAFIDSTLLLHHQNHNGSNWCFQCSLCDRWYFICFCLPLFRSPFWLKVSLIESHRRANTIRVCANTIGFWIKSVLMHINSHPLRLNAARSGKEHGEKWNFRWLLTRATVVWVRGGKLDVQVKKKIDIQD